MDRLVATALDKLAEAEVGRAGSTLIFVSISGYVRAVFTARSDRDAAVHYAQNRAGALRKHVIVEDAFGVVWDSQEGGR